MHSVFLAHWAIIKRIKIKSLVIYAGQAEEHLMKARSGAHVSKDTISDHKHVYTKTNQNTNQG